METMKFSRKLIHSTVAFAAVAFAVVFCARSAMGGVQLEVGDSAPNFNLPDQNGKHHSLHKLHGHVVLLAFYPADFTGGCTIEAHSLTAANKDLIALGVQTFGISVQDSASHSRFCSKEGIPYTLLADTTRKTSELYSGLIPAFNVAKRVTFIIGKDGKIVYIDPAVDSHINSCGADWVVWLRAHSEVTQ